MNTTHFITAAIVAVLCLIGMTWVCIDPRFKADQKPEPSPRPEESLQKEFTLRKLSSEFNERVFVFEGTHQQTGRKFIIILSMVNTGFSVAGIPTTQNHETRLYLLLDFNMGSFGTSLCVHPTCCRAQCPHPVPRSQSAIPDIQTMKPKAYSHDNPFFPSGGARIESIRFVRDIFMMTVTSVVIYVAHFLASGL